VGTRAAVGRVDGEATEFGGVGAQRHLPRCSAESTTK
jgi:hypothetical protein